MNAACVFGDEDGGEFAAEGLYEPEAGSACYHVMSRTVNGEFLFGNLEKELFQQMMWRIAKFSGVEIFTYVVMDNLFHILVKVPDQKTWLQRFKDRFCDVSLFVKELKERFRRWFNKQNARRPLLRWRLTLI